MKRVMISVVAVVFAAWAALYLFKIRSTPARRNDRPVAAQLPVTSGGGREETGSKRSPTDAKEADKTKVRPERRLPSARAYELATEELARRPELKAALNNNLRRLFRDAYGDLEKLLGIDRASARRIVDLLYEQALVARDAAIVMRERGIDFDNPQYDAILRNYRQELDAQIRATVGEDKFALLQLAPHVQLSQLELAKYYEGEFREIDAPLTPDQSLQLAIAMARFPVRDSTDDPVQTVSGPGQYLRPQSEIPLLEAAGKILTPAQLEVVRRRLVERNMEKDFQRQLKEEIYPAHGLKQHLGPTLD